MFSNNIQTTSISTDESVDSNVQEDSKTNEKETKNDYGFIDEKVLKMMAKMGFKKGETLGQNKLGLSEPIELRNNLGHRGLGHVTQNLEPARLNWDFNQETIEIEEKIHWLESREQDSKICVFVEQNKLIDWVKIVPKKLSISDESHYCDPILLQKVLKAKEVFDELDQLELCKARSRANPFETIKSAFFMNRAALKMANIDAVTGFMFTNIDRQVEHKQSKTPYYFADICAGPGGFSEYILWRKKWAFKGFGMTLRGDHDFKLHESSCAPHEAFEAHYGVLDNGDIYYPENIDQFCNQIKLQTSGKGVHFVMGDGGFSVEGQENIQEVLSKRLYICQCFTALNSLRTNGHFVVKMFDLFTPFSVGILYLMYHCFEKIAILKPNSSRPANSERYLICSKLKSNKTTDKIRKYMKAVIHILWNLHNNKETENMDIYDIVPASVIQEDKKFCEYITKSNNRLAEKQITALLKLATFCRDPSLFEARQEELRSQCLRFWQIPDKPKSSLPHLTIEQLLPTAILQSNFCNAKDFESLEHLKEVIEKPENWHCMFLGSSKKCNLSNVYVGIGNNRVYRYQCNKWIKVKCVKLIRGTILFGELIKEFTKKENKKYKKSLHVIDALRLGDTSLADLPYHERIELINIYCQAVSCPSRNDLAEIKLKKAYPFPKLHLDSLPSQTENGEWLDIVLNNNKKCCYLTNSILFLQTDSSQNFYSTISTRVVVHLTNESGSYIQTSQLWHNIVNLLQKIYFKTKNT